MANEFIARKGLIALADSTISGSLNVTGTLTGDGSGLTGVTAVQAPGGTDGQIQYNNAGVTGGASTLYWDDTNNRLGIGTSNPSRDLQVNGIIRSQADANNFVDIGSSGSGGFISGYGSGGEKFIIRSYANAGVQAFFTAGNVGIGTTSPTNKLEVVGSTQSTSYKISSGAYMFDVDATYLRLYSNGAGWKFTSWDNGYVDRITIKKTGEVGLGTTAPYTKLDIRPDALTGLTLPTFGTSAHSGIHIVPSGTATTDAWYGITFGNTAGGASERERTTAGIFTSAHGTYGNKLYFATSDSWATGAVSRMMVDNEGRVGIGTTTPDSLLELHSSTTTDFLKLTSGGSSANPVKLIFEKAATEQGIIEYNRNGDLEIYNTDGDGGVMINGRNSADGDLYVNNAGNVGIGTTSPSDKLDVRGNIKLVATQDQLIFANHFVKIQRDGSNYMLFNAYAGFKFYDTQASTERMRIDSSGNVGIGTTSPLHRLHIEGSGTSNDRTLILNNVGAGTTGIRVAGSGTWIDIANNLNNTQIVAFDTANKALKYQQRGSGGGNNAFPAHQFTGDANTSGAYPAILGAKGGAAGASLFIGQQADDTTVFTVEYDGKVGIGTDSPGSPLEVYGSGSTVLDIQGSQGQLFSVSDSLTGSLMSVNDISGLPILEVFDNDKVVMGEYGSNTLVVSGSKVGIGTDAPVHALDIDTTEHAGLRIQRSGVQRIISDASGNNGGFVFTGALGNKFAIGAKDNDFHIYDGSYMGNGDLRLAITQAGNVGIGTTSPSHKLDVNGDINIPLSTNYLRFGGQLGIKKQNNGAMHFYAGTNSSTGGFDFATWNGSTYDEGSVVIRNNGNVGIGTTSPGGVLDVDGTYGDLKIGDPSIGSRVTYYDTTRILLNSNHIMFYTDNLTERMRITSAGNVGIGTTTPASLLQVEGSANNVATFKSTDNRGSIAVQDDDTTTFVSAEGGMASIGRISGLNANNLNINSSGDVGIGLTNPTLGRLHVKQDSDAVTNGITVEETSGGNTMRLWMDGSTRKINAGGSATMMAFDATKLYFPTGNVGIGTASPSQKLTLVGNLLQSGTASPTIYMSSNTPTTGLNWSMTSRNDGYWLLGRVGIRNDFYFDPSGNATFGGSLTVQGNFVVNGTTTTINSTTLTVANKKIIVAQGATNAAQADLSGIEVDGVDASMLYTSASDSFEFNKSVVTSGDLTVAGRVTAQEFHTEFVSSSIIYESGSTKFGDTADDVHDFTGSLNIQDGDITVRSSQPGTNLILDNTGTGDPIINFALSGVNQFTLGVDDSDSDKFKIGTGGGLSATSEFTIDSSGKVGIGATSPDHPLHIVSAATGNATNLKIQSTSQYGGIGFFENTANRGTLAFGNDGNIFTGALLDSLSLRAEQALHLGAGGNNLSMTIGTNGNVGIGTTSPSQKLHVVGNGRFTSDLYVGSEIFHDDDYDTKIKFDTDRVRIYAGNALKFDSNNTYLTSESDTIDSVLTRGDVTNNTIHIRESDRAYTFRTSAGWGGWARTPFYFEQEDGTGFGGFGAYGGNGTTLSKYYIGSAYNNNIIEFHTNNNVIMSGNLGIGTTSPQEKLHVAGNGKFTGGNLYVEGSFPRIWLRDTDNNPDYSIINGNGTLRIYDDTNSADRFAISTSGNIGIGTTTPSYKLDVAGTTRFTGNSTSVGDTFKEGDILFRNNTAGDNVKIRDIDWRSTAAEGSDDRLGVIRVYTSAGSSTTRGGQMNFYTRQANSANFNTMIFDRSGNLYVPTNIFANSEQVATQNWVTSQGYITSAQAGLDQTTADARYVNVTGDTMTGTLTTQAVVPSSDSVYNLGSSSNRFLYVYSRYLDSGANTLELRSGGTTLFKSGSTERMRIDSSGRLLINATSTAFSDKLYVNGDAYTTGSWRVGSGTTYVGRLVNGSGALTLESDGNRDIKFGSNTNGTRMFIDTSSGNVGIGTTSPAQKLHVVGSVYANGGNFYTDNNGSLTAVGTLRFETFESSAYHERMRISASGNVGIGTTSPNAKLQVQSDTADSTVFAVDGVNGRLFSIDDSLDDSLFSVNTIAGLPVIEAFADNTVVMGAYGQNDLVISGSKVGIGIDTPTDKLHIHDSTSGDTPRIHFTNSGTGTGGSDGAYVGLGNGDDLVLLNYESGGHTDFYTAGNNRMRIENTGNVGIGTTSPATLLHVHATGNGNNALTVEDDARKIEIGRDQIQVKDLTDAVTNIYINPNGGNSILNANAGSVGIGTLSTPSRLTVNGDIRVANSGKLYLWNDHNINYIDYSKWQTSASAGMTIENQASAGHVKLVSNGNVGVYVNNNGNVGIGTTSPSEKLDVNGNINVDGRIEFFNSGYITNGGSGGGALDIIANGSVGNGNITINPATSSDALYLNYLNGGNIRFGQNGNSGIWTHSGQLGIATTSPASGYSLDVNGKIVSNQAVRVRGVETGNPSPAAEDVHLSGYGLVGNRGTVYLTNAGGNVQIGAGGGSHNSNPVATFQPDKAAFHKPLIIQGGAPSPETADGFGLEIMGNYTDGRWNHRFVKSDEGAGVPLYVQKTTSTANVWSNSARFGSYAGNLNEFEVYGNAGVSGDLTVGGVITAQEFRTEFITQTVIFESGSTAFGNSADDNHDFTGTVKAYNPTDMVGNTESGLLKLRHVASEESGLTYFDPAKPHAGINFEREWGSAGSTLSTLAKIHTYGETGWGGGLVFMTKPDDGVSSSDPVKVLDLTPDGEALFTGNVGIGYTNPSFKLDVNGSMRLNGEFNLVDGNVTLRRVSDGLRLMTSNLDRMTVTSSGNVGIGLTSPTRKLDVSGSVRAGGKTIYTKIYGSLDATGHAVAGLVAAGNGGSALFTFVCYGGGGQYQRIVYSCQNAGGIWQTFKVIDEGTNAFDVEVSPNDATVEFTFKTRGGNQNYSPTVNIEHVGYELDTTHL